MKIDIYDVIDGSVIYSHKQENNSIGKTLEKAAKERVDLRHADLRKLDLSRLNLAYINLADANLSESVFYETNLAFANFAYANLCEVNLAWAKLFGANFYCANLTDANIAWSDLHMANITDAQYGYATFKNGLLQLYGKEWPILIFDRHIKIGCELHETCEWEKFTDDEIADMDDDALSFWKANKEMILRLAKHHQGAKNAQEANQNTEQREAKKSGGSITKYMET